MNTTKVNTNIGGVASPESKKVHPAQHVGQGNSKPIFQRTERAPYEFGYLLRDLPRHLHGASLNTEQLEQIDAADKHACNSSLTLLDGLQSLGRVLWSAGVNESFPPEVGDFARVGTLITEIALQLELMNDFRQEVAEHNVRIAQNGARTGGQA